METENTAENIANECRPTTALQRLEMQRDDLLAQLKNTQEAISILKARPEIAENLQIVNRALFWAF